MNKNTKDFLKAFNAELGDKLDAGMSFMSTEFFEWMRDQYAPYEAAIEKDVRATSAKQFKAKWSKKRMDVKETFLPNEDSNEGNKSINDGKRTIMWVIDEMLADFDCIVDDDHSDKIADMHHWIDARISEATDSTSAFAPVKLNLARSMRDAFNSLFG